MSSVEAVIFDIGGVVIRDHVLKEQIFQAYDIKDRDAFWKLFNEAAMPACRGEEPLSECWKRMAKALGLALNDTTYRSLWISNFKESIEIDSGVLAIIQALKGKYRLGVVSNTIDEHAIILREMGVYSHFDHLVLSHEVRMTKDNPAIFDLALKGLDVAAGKAVFIDDVEKFALSAASKGIKSIVFKSALQLRAELRENGLELSV